MADITLFFAGALVLAAWLMPNHYSPWVSFHGEAAMGLALMLAAAGELWRTRLARVEITPLLLSVGVLAAIPLTQVALGQIAFAGDAWMACLYLVGAAFAIDLGRRLATGFGVDRTLETVAEIFLAGALLSIGVALFQWLRVDSLGVFAADLPLNKRPFANFAQPNHLASLLFLGLVGTLFLFERRRLNGVVTGLSCLFLAFGLSMTGSRTAWLAMAMLVAGVWWAHGRLTLRLSRGAVLGLAAAFIVMLVIWQPLNEALLLSGGRGLASQTQAGARILLWQTALDAISRAPGFGYGWNQGLVAQTAVAIDHPADGRLMGSAHTLLLDLMLWTGIPMGIAIFGGLLWWWGRHVRACRDATAFWLLAAISGVLVHALVEFPLSYAYFLLPVALLMGVLDQHAGVTARWRVRAPWAWGGAALASGLLVTTVIEYLQVEQSTQLLSYETARIGHGRITSTAPDLVLLTQWREYLRFARIETPRTDMTPAELAWMRQLSARFPYAVSQMRSAQAHALNGRPDIASLELQRLCSLQTKRRCQQQLAKWHQLTATSFPQLAAVTLPSLPPAP